MLMDCPLKQLWSLDLVLSAELKILHVVSMLMDCPLKQLWSLDLVLSAELKNITRGKHAHGLSIEHSCGHLITFYKLN